VIVDDDTLLAQSLAIALERSNEIKVLATSADLEEAMLYIQEFGPDVVVVDGELDGQAVDEFVEAVKSTRPTTGVVVLTRRADVALVARSLAYGASAVVEKSAVLKHLIRIIKASRNGKIVVENELLRAALRNVSDRTGGTALTNRELQVLRLLAVGQSTAEVARTLSIARNTARNYVQNILLKLGAHSRLEAVAIARRRDLVA
jgi:DNA-binding NarL/FixJ family response regulator